MNPIALIDEIAAMSDSNIESDGQGPAHEGEAPLFGAPQLANRKAPHYSVQQERPAHRIALELAAKGYDVKEIASMIGYTPVAVNNWLRQPHSQQTLVDTIRKNVSVDDKVVEIVKNNVEAAVKFYASVLADNNASRNERMEAAERLLNRRYGKPNQPINRGTDVDLNDLPDSELAKMLNQN